MLKRTKGKQGNPTITPLRTEHKILFAEFLQNIKSLAYAFEMPLNANDILYQ